MAKELSLLLRIPAENEYIENAITTFEGICEHCNINTDSALKIQNALQDIIKKNIAAISENAKGLFELNFSVTNNNVCITIENFLINETEKLEDELKNIKSHLEFIYDLADNAKISNTENNKLIYSIQFNI